MNTKVVRAWKQSATVYFKVWDWINPKDVRIYCQAFYIFTANPCNSQQKVSIHNVPLYCEQTTYNTEKHNLNAVHERKDFQLLQAASYGSTFNTLEIPLI